MKIYTPLILALIVYSCSSSNTSQEDINENLGNWHKQIDFPNYARSLDSAAKIKSKNDTLLLGYVLGWSRNEVKNHTNALIKSQVISDIRQQSFDQIWRLRDRIIFDTLTTWQGYDYVFIFPSKIECKGFLNFAYNEDKLRYLRFFITSKNDLQELILFISKKYGDWEIMSTYSNGENWELQPVFTWVSGGKEIQLCTYNSNTFIQYTDIDIRNIEENENVARNKKSIFYDSLNRIERTQEVKRKKNSDSLLNLKIEEQAKNSYKNL